MKRTTLLYTLLIVIAIQISSAYANVTAPRNPNSAKECALCHYRWIDTFFIDGRGSDLVEYQADQVVARPEICFSCHDGSVANTDIQTEMVKPSRHPVDVTPNIDHDAAKVEDPLRMRLHVECGDCHNSHATQPDQPMVSVNPNLPGGGVGQLVDRLLAERMNAQNLEKSLENLKALAEG